MMMQIRLIDISDNNQFEYIIIILRYNLIQNNIQFSSHNIL